MILCDSCGTELKPGKNAVIRLTAQEITFKTIWLCKKCEKTVAYIFDRHSEDD